MDIVIGQISETGSATQYRSDGEPALVEARLLEIRDRRKDASGAGSAASGRVITLLVPDGQRIPRGVETGEYRIYLRFVNRRQGRY